MPRKRIKPKATRERGRGRNASWGPWEPSARDMEMFHAYNSGKVSYRDLSEAYGVALSTISDTFRQINGWLFPQFVENIRQEKLMQTESLRHIFHQAMEQWERSKQDGVTVTEKDVAIGKDKRTGIEKTKTTKGQCGDPRFLAEARAALDDIRRIWGMNAAIQVEMSGELRVAGLTVEQANQQLLERIDHVKGRLMQPSVN